MSPIIDNLVNSYEHGHITRRDLIVSLSALVMARPTMAAQSSAPPIAARTFNHLVLQVSDPQRSQNFYQRLFGLRPIKTRGARPLLVVGSGPQYLGVGPVQKGEKPALSHFCFGVKDFNSDRIMKTLADHGVKGKLDMLAATDGGKVPAVYIHDPDGFEIQLQDESYCGGAGPLGNVCP